MGKDEGDIRTVGVNCGIHSEFCNGFNYKKKSRMIVGVAAPQDKWALYDSTDSHQIRLEPLKIWMDDFLLSLEDVAYFEGVGYPAETIDSLTKLNRDMEEMFEPIQQVFGSVFTIISKVFGSFWWFFSPVISM